MAYSRLFDKMKSLVRPVSLAASSVPKHRSMSSVSLQNLRCYGLPCSYDEDEWESVETFMDSNDILKPVPSNRLITNLRPDQPYLSTEIGNRFFWSVGIIPFKSRRKNVSTSGLFTRGSLGVIKPLGVLGVKDFMFSDEPLDDNLIRSDWAETKAFIMSLLKLKFGSDIIHTMPRPLQRWLNQMDAVDIDEEDIAFNSYLLPKESRYLLMLDVYSQLKKMKLIPQKDKEMKLNNILSAIPDKKIMNEWPMIREKDPLINHWMTFKPGRDHGPKQKAAAADKGERMEDNSTAGGEKMETEKMRTRSLTEGEKQDGAGKKRRRKRERRNKKKGEEKVSEVAGEGQRKKIAGKKGVKKTKKLTEMNVGKELVKLHRHSFMHLYEKIVLALLKQLSMEHASALTKNPPTLWDVLDLLEHEVSVYLQQAMAAIKQHSPELWNDINIKGRFILPFTMDEELQEQKEGGNPEVQTASKNSS